MKSLLLFTLLSTAALAAPSHIEVWLISNTKVTSVEKLLDQRFVFRAPTAELQCQEMGEYCFDPQFGLYKKDDTEAEVEAGKVLEDKSKSMAHGRSLDRELIDCEKGNYFDMFCGKARAQETKKAKLELWIDTSSSMKEFDYTDKDGSCYRKSLVKRLDDSCSFNQEVNIMMFDTSIKQAGTMDSLCNNRGLNDFKRLMDWIERSDARNLVIITDIYELHKDFADYIASKNGTVIGDKNPLTASEMVKKVDQLAKLCR